MSSQKSEDAALGSRLEAKSILKTTEKTGAHFPPFRVDLKYRNTLPEVPFDPHFLEIPFPNDFLWGFKQSTLERNYKYKIHMNPPQLKDDFIDPLSTEEWAKAVVLDDKDKALISKDAVEAKATRASRAVKEAKTWMLKTIYTRENMHRTTNEFQQQEDDDQAQQTSENALGEVTTDRESRVTVIKRQFQAAESPDTIKPPPGKKVKRVYPFLPHRALRELDLYLIRFKAGERIMPDDVDVEIPSVVRRSVLVKRKEAVDYDDDEDEQKKPSDGISPLSLFLPASAMEDDEDELSDSKDEDADLFADEDEKAEEEEEQPSSSKKKRKTAGESEDASQTPNAHYDEAQGDPAALEYVREYAVQAAVASKHKYDRLALIFDSDAVRYAELEQESLRVFRTKQPADEERRRLEKAVKVVYRVDNTEDRDDAIITSAQERRAKTTRRRAIEGGELDLEAA